MGASLRKTFFGALLGATAALTQSAFADSVDAANKPVMVLGGLAAGAACGLLGVYLILRGSDARKRAAQSLLWPTTDGEILAAAVKTEVRTDAQGARSPFYIPAARYSYIVAGTHYSGDVIRPGLVQFPYGQMAQAQAHIDLYKVGAKVPVHYDPAHPSVAVLETAETGGIHNNIAGYLLLTLAIGGLLFAVWASTLEIR
jgi:hypothetical protein